MDEGQKENQPQDKLPDEAEQESISTYREVFETSLQHGNPFTLNLRKRQEWFDNLNPPKIELSEITLGEKGLTNSKGDWGEVFVGQWKGREVAIKIYHKEKLDNVDKNIVLYEYAGEMLAKVLGTEEFTEPFGVIYEDGEPIGLVEEFVSDARELGDLYYDNSNYDSLMDWKSVDINQLREVEKSLIEMYKVQNIVFLDTHKRNILVTKDGKVRIVDLHWFPGNFLNEYTYQGGDDQTEELDYSIIDNGIIPNTISFIQQYISDWEMAKRLEEEPPKEGEFHRKEKRKNMGY